jgi:secreted trypsin-like serine protease
MALQLKCDSKMFATFSQVIIFLSLSLCPLSQIAASTHESWPWLAYIPSLNCTGAIVHSRWMLTTSHCFANKSVPSKLFAQIQAVNTTGNGQGVRLIYVIDYTRDGLTHGLTMLYLAQTIPSWTRNVVPLRAKNANVVETGIVMSWDSRRASDDNTVNIFALSVDFAPCVADSTRICASLSKHSSGGSTIFQYCSRIGLGSSLVTIDENGRVALVGVLHERAGCSADSNFVGMFSRVDHGRDWIRQQFRIQGQYVYKQYSFDLR